VIKKAEETISGFSERIKKDDMNPENIIVLAGTSIIDGVLEADKIFYERSFFAEVDPSRLDEKSYIRLPAMLEVAITLAGKKNLPVKLLDLHDKIKYKIVEGNARRIILYPEAEKLDIEIMPEVYKAHVEPIRSA